MGVFQPKSDVKLRWSHFFAWLAAVFVMWIVPAWAVHEGWAWLFWIWAALFAVMILRGVFVEFVKRR